MKHRNINELYISIFFVQNSQILVLCHMSDFSRNPNIACLWNIQNAFADWFLQCYLHCLLHLILAKHYTRYINKICRFLLLNFCTVFLNVCCTLYALYSSTRKCILTMTASWKIQIRFIESVLLWCLHCLLNPITHRHCEGIKTQSSA